MCFFAFMFSLFSLLLYVFIDVRLSHLNKDYLLTYLLTYCDLTLEFWAEKTNHFSFVPNWTKVENMVKFADKQFVRYYNNKLLACGHACAHAQTGQKRTFLAPF